jgi:hypothetical protein
MLNRYGLFDIEKFLREQDEPQAPAVAPPEGAPPAAPAPPAPPPEDPDERIDKARQKNQDADLVDFRKRHGDLIYQVANAYGSKSQRIDANAFVRDLKQRFDRSGVDKPFFVLFDPATTGLDGDRHLSFIAAMHHEGVASGSQVTFHSAGDAASFAENAALIRDDLSFEVDGQDATVVNVASAQEQPEAAAQQA